jgi:membrane protein YqaA with SNARE-associated domain
MSLIAAKSGMRWLIHLGGPGLILLGLADNSVVPLPGSMDVLTIWLAATHRSIWFYYAGMATVGAVLGGYITYRIARKGGKAALEGRVSRKTADKLYAGFERWGYGAIAIPALLPPPFPIVPMLLAAGALQYPRKRFLTALAMGRGVRFTIIAFLGARYGGHVTEFFSHYYKPAVLVLIALSLLAGIWGLRKYLHSKRHEARSRAKARQRAA